MVTSLVKFCMTHCSHKMPSMSSDLLPLLALHGLAEKVACNMAWKLRFPEELPAVIAFEIPTECLQIILKFEGLILQVIEFDQIKINQ